MVPPTFGSLWHTYAASWDSPLRTPGHIWWARGVLWCREALVMAPDSDEWTDLHDKCRELLGCSLTLDAVRRLADLPEAT